MHHLQTSLFKLESHIRTAFVYFKEWKLKGKWKKCVIVEYICSCFIGNVFSALKKFQDSEICVTKKLSLNTKYTFFTAEACVFFKAAHITVTFRSKLDSKTPPT